MNFHVYAPSADSILFETQDLKFRSLMCGYTLECTNPNTSVIGYIVSGSANIHLYNGENDESIQAFLCAGSYFSMTFGAVSSLGTVLLFEQSPFTAMPMLGGPIDKQGRLLYIDGCTDSLLVPPVIKGYPCLNLLHFPTGIDQTAHTHPSERLGVVVAGHGECEVDEGIIPLLPGTVFRIPTGATHKFRTLDSSMDVVAYHPDSDFGPEHQDHPMVNRTFVHGQSARYLDNILTKKAVR